MKNDKVIINSEELANMIEGGEIHIDNNEDAGHHMCPCHVMC